MAKKPRLIFLVVFILILVSIIILALFVKDSLVVSTWRVEATLLDNGDLVVQEDITFSFNKKFNGVFRHISLNQTDGITDLHVFLVEYMDSGVKPYEKVINAKNGDEGVYTIENENEELTVKIYSPSTKGDEKTFRFKYTVTNVATKYQDIGELYYIFVGTNNDTQIEEMDIYITLPKTIYHDTVDSFVHASADYTLEKYDDQTFKLLFSNIGKQDLVETRIVFPTEYIFKSNNVVNKQYLSTILNAETAYQDKLARELWLKNILAYLSIGGSIIGIICMSSLAFVFRRRKRHDISFVTSIPEDCTPAIAALLMNRPFGPNQFVATILDLKRKGYIKITTNDALINRNEKKLLEETTLELVKHTDGLLSHEKRLIRLLFDEVGMLQKFTLQELNNFSKLNGDRLAKGFHEWQQEVHKNARDKGYYDDSLRKFGVLLIAFGLILLLISLMTMSMGVIWGGIGFIVFIFVFIYGISFFSRLSDVGYKKHQEWKAFMEWMKEKEKSQSIQDLMNEPNTASTSQIYALGLGIKTIDEEDAHKMMSNLYEKKDHWSFWFVLFVYHRPFRRALDIQDIGVSTGSSQLGGGLTGGGGGGAGGGGVGGF